MGERELDRQDRQTWRRRERKGRDGRERKGERKRKRQREREMERQRERGDSTFDLLLYPLFNSVFDLARLPLLARMLHRVRHCVLEGVFICVNALWEL